MPSDGSDCALGSFEKATELNYNNLGIARRVLGMFSEARADYAEADARTI